MVSTFICNLYLEKLENEKISWFLFCWISFTIREDVRGVVCVALTTPIFQDLFYIPSELLAIQTSDHMAFWSSSHTAFWPSRLLTIRPSDHPTTCSSGYLVIQTSDNPDLWPSGLLAIRPSDYPVIRSFSHPVFWPSSHRAIPTSGLLSQCLRNVLIGIYLAYLVAYTNLKFLTSSLFAIFFHIC